MFSVSGSSDGLPVPWWQFRGPSTAGGRGDSGLERPPWGSSPWRCDGSGQTGSLERPQLPGRAGGGGGGAVETALVQLSAPPLLR